MGLRQWLSEKAAIVRVLGAVLACTIGARIVSPGINPDAIGDFFRSGGASPLLRLYDWFVGGAMARGGLFALGVLPYISARIYLRVASVVWPRMAEPARRTRLTRWLTFGFSAVQSLGFAKFLENLPGAVTNPGPQFIATTVLTLTASAMATMWLWELGRSEEHEHPEIPEATGAQPDRAVQPARDSRLLNASAPEFETVKQKEPVVVDRP
jgi:preprotein translocase subunit SecY